MSSEGPAKEPSSMPLAEWCTIAPQGSDLNVQTLWETLDHSTAHQEQTQLLSAPTKVSIDDRLSAPCQSGTRWATLGQGQPHQMHTNILLVPSACAGFSSGSYCVVDHSAPDLSNKIWEYFQEVYHSVQQSGTRWGQQTYFPSCSELEIALRP